MKVEDFVAITKDLCGFPSFFNAPFFKRICIAFNKIGATSDVDTPPSSTSTTSNAPMMETPLDELRVTKDMFQTYWLKELAPFDEVERFFRAVKQPQNDYIERDDFAPFLHGKENAQDGYLHGFFFNYCIINNRTAQVPSWFRVFSRNARISREIWWERSILYQMKCLIRGDCCVAALTVVVRIFYSVDRDSSGRITLRKLRRSRLIDSFNIVDEEEDINKVNAFFSYEHFYVLYCKFWELDTDHDFQLSQDDLARYGGHSLTRVMVDRIFEHGRRPFARVQTLTTEEKKSMSYEDFICEYEY